MQERFEHLHSSRSRWALRSIGPSALVHNVSIVLHPVYYVC